MSRPVLILRPEPGAARTAARAEELGVGTVVAPIFTIERTAWQPPDAAEVQAVLLTSANAARLSGEGLGHFAHLPAYAVGEATAAAARNAGLGDVRTGPSDGAALLEMMAADGIFRALHPCGADHLPLEREGIFIERRIVYASRPARVLPSEAVSALAEGALALLYSPRAASHFARLVEHSGIGRSRIGIAAISLPAATAAGAGWMSVSVASEPRDDALLELAAKLCKTGQAPHGK